MRFLPDICFDAVVLVSKKWREVKFVHTKNHYQMLDSYCFQTDFHRFHVKIVVCLHTNHIRTQARPYKHIRTNTTIHRFIHKFNCHRFNSTQTIIRFPLKQTLIHTKAWVCVVWTPKQNVHTIYFGKLHNFSCFGGCLCIINQFWHLCSNWKWSCGCSMHIKQVKWTKFK